MTNKRPEVNILVEGTCLADPEDSEEEVYNKIEAYDQREVTGGPSAVAITVPPVSGHGFHLLYDSGDTLDREKLLESFEELEYDREDIDYVLASHTHLDHLANNSLFPNAEWLIPVGDRELKEWLEGEGMGEYYQQLRREVDYTDFDRFDPEHNHIDHWPWWLQVEDTDGHQKGHLSLLLDQNREESIITRNVESGDEYETERVIAAGDAVLNKDYAENLLDGDWKNAVYNISSYEGVEEQIQKAKEVGSLARLLDKARDKDSIIIPGHGKEFSFENLGQPGSENASES